MRSYNRSVKLVTFSRRFVEGATELRPRGVGALVDGGIYDLTRTVLYWAADNDPAARAASIDLRLLVGAAQDRLEAVADLLSSAESEPALDTDAGPARAGEPSHSVSRSQLIALEEVDLRAPLLAPGKIICVGLNYRDHCREQGIEPPGHPVLFAKFANAVTDPGASVCRPEWTQQLDMECELAVIVGARARKVSREVALDHVFGYTILNDVTARDAQRADRQWLRAKGADGFAPMGPVLVTADELPEPQSVRIRSSVNGETWQDSSTAEMVFDVAELISFASHAITLEPGDVIATGTPAGVGHFQRPPRYLEPGDVMTCEIEGIGRLENAIVEAGNRALVTRGGDGARQAGGER